MIVKNTLISKQEKVYFFVALMLDIRFFNAMDFLLSHRLNTIVLTHVGFGLLFVMASLLSPPLTSSAYAQEAKLVVQGSGLPVPRFVTLKSDEVNMRVGPGREYPKSWVYRRKGLPLKVIAEFDVWRKVIDHENTTGWVHSQLVTLKRNALIVNRLTKLHAKADETSPVLAVAEKGVLLELQLCDASWCRVASDDVRAFVRRDDIWGILDTETLD